MGDCAKKYRFGCLVEEHFARHILACRRRSLREASQGHSALNLVFYQPKSRKEVTMKLDARSGAAIAAAAATLFLAGVNMSTPVFAADEGHCIGANACKGQSACKGGNHSCKGLNACKGQGFAEMTKADCAAAKGKFKAG